MPHDTGCTARITQWDMPQTGIFQLRTAGEQVFRIVSQRTDKLGLIHAEVELLEPAPAQPMPAEHAELTDLLQHILEHAGTEHFSTPNFSDAAWVGNRLLDVLPLPLVHKLRLLEQRNPQATLDAIHDFIATNQPEK